MSARYLSWVDTAPVIANGRPSVGVLRSVLFRLASHANTAGQTWPSVERLSRESGFGRTSVSLALSALAEQGFIIPVGGRSGGKRSTRWWLQPAAPENATVPLGNSNDDDNRSPRGTNRSPRGTNRSPRKRDTAVTRKKPQVTTRRTPTASEHDRATVVVRSWWERQQPKPQQPFPAVVKVVAKALRGGWTEPDLVRALDEVPVVSGGTLDYWRRRRQPNSNNALTDQQHAAIHEYVRRVDARKAQRKARP